MNVMTLLEQTDRALTLYANQFAGRSIVLDKCVYDILDTSLLNGGVFLAAYWWLWFEADESGVHESPLAVPLSPPERRGPRSTTAVRC